MPDSDWGRLIVSVACIRVGVVRFGWAEVYAKDTEVFSGQCHPLKIALVGACADGSVISKGNNANWDGGFPVRHNIRVPGVLHGFDHWVKKEVPLHGC